MSPNSVPWAGTDPAPADSRTAEMTMTRQASPGLPPQDLRTSSEKRIPLLVVGSDWDRVRRWLLDVEPSTPNSDPDDVVRSVLRGFRASGPLPGHVDPTRLIQAVVVLGQGPGPAELAAA